MHPAFSVLIFTVTSGAGYGLMSLLILGHLTGSAQLQDSSMVLSAGFLALALVTGGLLSSTLHLSNPKNAWRAFSRFKTSWLSREAVFAVLFYPFSLIYLISSWGAEELTLTIKIAGTVRPGGVGQIKLAVGEYGGLRVYNPCLEPRQCNKWLHRRTRLVSAL